MASSGTIQSLQRQHPLQRLSSPSRGFSALVHLVLPVFGPPTNQPLSSMHENPNVAYPYPIFEAVGFEGRIGLFALSAVTMALSTGTLKWLYGRVNGYGTSAKAQSRPGAIKSNGNI
ncbi:integral membrane protein [Aspergillus luchuensis]|uniref:Integral membrane protein n=1 Tax=Aspergillus kawachii TaxID=1069201 RepID=A0A146FNK1_ASPKA|nr:integral membrane protein [Aspergillus luchuensis]